MGALSSTIPFPWRAEKDSSASGLDSSSEGTTAFLLIAVSFCSWTRTMRRSFKFSNILVCRGLALRASPASSRVNHFLILSSSSHLSSSCVMSRRKSDVFVRLSWFVHTPSGRSGSRSLPTMPAFSLVSRMAASAAISPGSMFPLITVQRSGSDLLDTRSTLVVPSLGKRMGKVPDLRR
jgi:hypothetical protein